MNNDWQSALGILAPYYNDPLVSDIMLDAYDQMSIVRKHRLQTIDLAFASADELLTFARQLAHIGGSELDIARPVNFIRLPDHSRVTIVLPPVAVNGTCIIIKKHLHQAVTWDFLVDAGSLTRQAVACLQHAIHANVNIALAGTAGSGKTTIMNLLAGSIGAQERVIVVEPEHVLAFDHPHTIFLEISSAAKATFHEVFNAALRLMPEWLVVNEVNGSEAFQVLQALATGHSGILSLAAHSTDDVLQRLETWSVMANPALGLHDLRPMIAAAIQLIVIQKRLSDGKRRITDICELRGIEHNRFALNPLFRYNPVSDKIEATGNHATWS